MKTFTVRASRKGLSQSSDCNEMHHNKLHAEVFDQTSFPVTPTVMAAKIYIAFWWTCLVAFVCADQTNITAEVGQDVTLTCRAPKNKTIRAVKWSRADLRSEYVLLYRNKHFVPDHQHPSFENRVDLQDRQMKDGDVSLILKDVTINDTGTYECGVIQTGTGLELINSTNLIVVPSGQTGGDPEDGSVGLIVGLIVFALLVVVAAAGFLIYRKHEKTKSQDPYQPPAELQPV